MPLVNIWEAKVVQSYPSVDQVLNVYHFEDTSSSSPANTVADDLTPVLVTNMRTVQNTSLTYTQMLVRNLGDIGRFYEKTFTATPGSGGNQANPRFVAWSFRVTRLRTDMRHGYKRICGVPEEMVSGGQPTSGATTAFTGTILPALGSLIAGHLKYVVLKRIKYTTTGGKDAWRLPETEGELVFYYGNTLSFTGITTQNTRKR